MMHKTLKSRVVTIAGQIVGPLHVRFGSKADMCSAQAHVRFPESEYYVSLYVRVVRGRSIRLEIDGFDHAPPFDDVGSKHRVGSFLIKAEGFKAELLETRGHFWIF